MSGPEIVSDTVANATIIFSLATKSFGLVTRKWQTDFSMLQISIKGVKLHVKQTFHIILLCFHHKNVPNRINKASLFPNLYPLLSMIFSNLMDRTILYGLLNEPMAQPLTSWLVPSFSQHLRLVVSGHCLHVSVTKFQDKFSEINFKYVVQTRIS